MSTNEKNVEVVFEIFNAIERRDPQRPDVQRGLALFHPDVEFHWPPRCPTVERHAVCRPSVPLGAARGTRCSRLRPSDGWIPASWPPATRKS